MVDRRKMLRDMTALVATAAFPDLSRGSEHHQFEADKSTAARTKVRKIATEEAFTIPEVAEAVREVVRKGGSSLDLKLLALVYANETGSPANVPSSAATSTTHRDNFVSTLLPRLLDIDEIRLNDMDANAVDVHVLSLSAPGVQMFTPDQAVALAHSSNDRLSDFVLAHPTRFAGLAAFAPQNVSAAVKEMERAVGTLKLNGFLVNSHTNGVYLDEERCWPILEAAESLQAPLYIHPRSPSDGMAAPFRDYRMEGPIWGYAVEAGTHAVRLMLSGVLDRFPRLRIVLGHMGEALPFWMWRLDYMASPGSRAGLRNKLKPSEYLRRNFAITTSGVEDPLVLRFCIEKLGIENIMWAIDYPYQPTTPAVAFLDSTPLSDLEREQISYGNAERIFKIVT